MPLVCLNQIQFQFSRVASFLRLKEMPKFANLFIWDLFHLKFFSKEKFHFVMSVAKENLDHKQYANPVLILRMTNAQT